MRAKGSSKARGKGIRKPARVLSDIVPFFEKRMYLQTLRMECAGYVAGPSTVIKLCSVPYVLNQTMTVLHVWAAYVECITVNFFLSEMPTVVAFLTARWA